MSPTDPMAAAIAATTDAIEKAVDAGQRPPALGTLAAAAHVSTSHLRREFVARVGITPKAYADARRAERLREQLASGTDVTDAIHGSVTAQVTRQGLAPSDRAASSS